MRGLRATGVITVELVYDAGEELYLAWVPGLFAYGEGLTKDEAIRDLRRALRGYIQILGLEGIRNRVEGLVELHHLPWDLAELAESGCDAD